MSNDLYRIRINGEYFYDVKAPDVETALMLAMGLYKETLLPKVNPEQFEHFEIYFENMTQLKAFQETDIVKMETKLKLQEKDKIPL